MNQKFLSFAKHYLFGLITSSWNGSIGAVAAILGVDAVAFTGADAALPAGQQSARVLNVHEMISCFVGAFVLHAFLYFKSHPLPETLDTNSPFPAPKDV